MATSNSGSPILFLENNLSGEGRSACSICWRRVSGRVGGCWSSAWWQQDSDAERLKQYEPGNAPRKHRQSKP
jgi:hypothetical protein